MRKYLLLLIGGLVMILSGCTAKQYHVDYDGVKDFYAGAKDTYPAGAQVELYFDLIATDTDYSFFLDDERLNFNYVEGKGFKITFTMPDHDVKLTYDMRNSMVYQPAPKLLLNYTYEDSDTIYALLIYRDQDQGDKLDVVKDGDVTSYQLSSSCYKKVMKLITDHDVSSYLGRPAKSTGDHTITLSFLKDGTMVEVTSAQMAEHEDVLIEIQKTLESYIIAKKKYR